MISKILRTKVSALDKFKKRVTHQIKIYKILRKKVSAYFPASSS
jgi:hypothetical protein